MLGVKSGRLWVIPIFTLPMTANVPLLALFVFMLRHVRIPFSPKAYGFLSVNDGINLFVLLLAPLCDYIHISTLDNHATIAMSNL